MRRKLNDSPELSIPKRRSPLILFNHPDFPSHFQPIDSNNKDKKHFSVSTQTILQSNSDKYVLNLSKTTQTIDLSKQFTSMTIQNVNSFTQTENQFIESDLCNLNDNKLNLHHSESKQSQNQKQHVEQNPILDPSQNQNQNLDPVQMLDQNQNQNQNQDHNRDLDQIQVQNETYFDKILNKLPIRIPIEFPNIFQSSITRSNMPISEIYKSASRYSPMATLLTPIGNSYLFFFLFFSRLKIYARKFPGLRTITNPWSYN